MSIGQHSKYGKTDKLLAASKELLSVKGKWYSGKCPRPGDCDVTAAPDAAESTQISNR